MKAIILAAGQGTRLLPFTRDNPKCLVPVAGRAILDHQLAALAQAGIEEAVIVAGYRADRIAVHLAAMEERPRTTLLCNPFWPVANSISSVWTARAALGADFCLLNGDTIFSGALVADALLRAGPGVSLLVEPTDDFQLDDMLVVAEDARVRAVGKAIAEGTPRHRSLGFIIARGPGPALYADALEAVICADGGHARYHHAIIDRLAWAGDVAAVESGGANWAEIDRPEDIARWSAP